MQNQKTIFRLVLAPALSALIPQFLADMAPAVVPSTGDAYRRQLGHFAAWLGPEATLADVNAAQINAYVGTLLARGLQPSTIAGHTSTISRFVLWQRQTGRRQDDPMLAVSRVHVPDGLPRPLSSTQLAQLVDALNTPPPAGAQRAPWNRHRLTIATMLYSGVRLSEAARLTWGDLDFAAGTLRIVRGKGNKSRVVGLHPALAAAARAWCVYQVPDAPLLAYSQRRALRPKSLAHTFDRWLLKQFGLEISAHQLRHTCATQMLNYGADLKMIQETLGHESLETTQGYAQLEAERKRRAVAVLPNYTPFPVERGR